MDILDGSRVPVSAAERAQRPGEVPYYGASGQVGTIDKAIFDEPLLLLGEDGVQFFDPLKPKAYRIHGPAWVNNHAHVLRTRPVLDQTFLEHYLNQFNFHGFANGTTRLKLTQGAMRLIPVPVPALSEQRRIVAILEEHLTSLDLAQDSLNSAHRRSAALLRSSLWTLTHGHGRDVRLYEIADVRLGRQRSPKNHQGDHMVPYLRAANVDWNRLRLDDVKEMNFTPSECALFSLRPGDILLTEASGSPSEVGKSAIYQGELGTVCFQNTLLMVRCHSADPEYVQKYLLADAYAGRFKDQSRGVGIHHLGRARLATWEVELPDEREQAEVVRRVGDAVSSGARLEQELVHAVSRARALRRGMLAAAFSGQLTGRSSDTDIIEDLADQEEAS